MHDGTLTAASPGRHQGATFSLVLPTVEKPVEVPEDQTKAPDSKRQSRSLRILLVDDHVDTREGLERLLRRKGHAVQTADGVESALGVAAAHQFDLLISDLGLPDGTGYELMTRLRQSCSIAGIAISGFGMDGDVEKSKACGFTEHLLKPIEFARLEAVIQAVTA
jgi:CheY-like chemotaxis protein